MSSSTSRVVMSSLLIGLLLLPVMAISQDVGPYNKKSSTVLLLHFNGDYENESDLTADPEKHGNPQLVDVNPNDDFGKQLKLVNEYQKPTSYLSIADDPDLDLTNSWKMSAWFYIDDYGKSYEEANANTNCARYPRILFKPGDRFFAWRNYNITAFKSRSWLNEGQVLMTGYAGYGGLPSVTSPNNSINKDKWYHVTFIRNHKTNKLHQILYKSKVESPTNNPANLELVSKKSTSFSKDHTPLTNSQNVYIGTNPRYGKFCGGDLNGYVDEIRISNTLRRKVAIDVKPGSEKNPTNPSSNGVTPVAILSEKDFDATTVDHTTVRFGDTGKETKEFHSKGKNGELIRHEEDVNNDGMTDLVFHFRTSETGITSETKQVQLTGETFNGQAIYGVDNVKVVGNKSGGSVQASNHPNPFNPATRIQYHLPKETDVKISIYNIKGQLIKTLVNKHQSAGNHSVRWNASQMASGIYIYKLKTRGTVKTKKMMLLK